ncbi:MAG TPA: LON peptidase substrate-binding domain-containing protein, partial [Polyangiales bacterium]|nr:LON peptidase substrate-binding domain-containing protein [Polyangiales bacterium]
RFALLLRGVARVELANELPAADRMYRRVAAKQLIDAAIDERDAADHQRRLISLCDRLAEVLDQGGPQLRDLVRAFDAPGMCADAVAAALIMDIDARQELLEACCPLERLQRTMGHVGHLLCELAPCEAVVN